MATAPAARRTWLALVCACACAGAAAAGCFSDRGVAIEVAVGATGATTVELFLGKTACDGGDGTAGIACTTIAPPPDGSVPLDGSIWFRDAPERYVADVAGRTATFHIRTDSPHTVPVAIAVGFAPDPQNAAAVRPVATATLRDLTIPVNSARVITTALVAAAPVQLPPGDTRALIEDRVLVWSKQSPASSCLVVEHWDHGAHQRDLIVPEDDPDCDDVAAPECNPAAFHGDRRVGGAASRPDCFAPAGPVCVLGGLGCSDDQPGKTTACVAQPEATCVPGKFCGAACDRYDEACVRMLAADPAIAHIDCDVPTVMPVLDLCPGAAQIAPIALDAHFQGAKCDRQPTISSLAVPGFDTHAKFAGAEMDLGSPSQPCHFDLQWKSGPRAIGETTDYGLIQVGTDERALLIPIVFHFLPGACGVTPFKCTVAGAVDDSVWSCAP